MINYYNNKEKTNEGIIIIFSSPSGGGKTTIAKKLAEGNKNMEISISATSRIKNKSEIDGKDYFFISKEKFEEQIENNEFLEYAEIYGNFYGTIKENIYKIIKNGQAILFDIDWQGHRSIRQRILDVKIISFFIVPPSIEILKERLRSRNRENELVIQERLDQAINEMSYKNEYDYIIVNDNLNKAIEEIEKIIMKFIYDN
jgi:guanylate kinase